nr:IS3 family transposase [Bacillus cereus]
MLVQLSCTVNSKRIKQLYYLLTTEKDLVQEIEKYVYFYNYKRFQKRLNHRAPIEYRISMAA